MNNNTKILIYGAGAIGSIFAGMMAKAGYDITVLDRGKRYDELRQKGLILSSWLSNKKLQFRVKTIDILSADDTYDYIIAAVQNTQIDSILPILSKNKSQNIVFVVNNPSGYKKWINAVGYEKIIIGFPSAAGEKKDGIVHYFLGKDPSKLFQATTFGELNGKKTERLLKLVKIFKNSGFSPCINNNMEAWQKTHAAVILPIGKALYRFDSNNYKLSESYGAVKKMVLATRECFKVLNKMNTRITPRKLNFYYFPLFLIVPVYMLVMNSKIAEFAMAKPVLTAKDGMAALEKQFRLMIKDSGLMTPNFDSL